ncbi:conjugal transfer protein TraA [Rhizobium sp. SEMIA 4085]|uniref:Conjugal transfer protein TraA n=1 Tax=Rhizobium gallicum bv. gallicum R602sp TaxID=1041138 RepID=A0A0B4XAM2_9HYPH|nr:MULTISPECIES: hypothetical protein [Rhizobium]AJD44151.1 hypothetical protein RGR602_PC00104 [Rhizobium gallicum bv. gallicum R602sp]NNH30617.1 conjugal transfer protein TraA [Rhizobium sp. SEMIA 4085]
MEFFPGAFETDWERRKTVLLREQSLLHRRFTDEDELRRRGGVVPTASPLPGSGAGRLGFGKRSGIFARAKRQGHASEPSMRSRFAGLASGSQPAVVKMASFGGGGRLGAMVNYVSRNGGIVVENERGEQLKGRDELATVRAEWDHLMKNRAESRDIGAFSLEVKEPADPAVDVHERARVLLKRGFGDRSFAYAVTPHDDGNGYRIEGVTILRDSEGERLTGDKKASEIVQGRLGGEGAEQEEKMAFRFSGYGNGGAYGLSRLRDLVDRHHGAVQDDKGNAIADAKQAGDLVQLEWRDQLHSRKPRDVMHVIMSARAGTDVQAFHAAARDFLAQEFAGHRYVFSLHDPFQDPKAEDAGGKRPHVHVHAIVAMRSDAGDRIETTIPAFRRWRVTLAEKARARGIRMEMTDRRERASAAVYTRNQVRPTSRAGRTQHEGTSPAAQLRYDAKRADRQSVARTEESRIYSNSARQEWLTLARKAQDSDVRQFASNQIKRLESAASRIKSVETEGSGNGNFYSQFRTSLVKLMKVVSEGETMRHMTRQEFEVYEKRVETALLQAERVTPDEQRKSFHEIATAAREHVNVRRELMELRERSVPPERDGERAAREQDDDPRTRWDDAVGRHGLRAVETANQVMVEVERYRDEIEKAEFGKLDSQKATLEAGLQREIAKAAELGAAGNTLIREIAQVDEELRLAIERAEHSRDGRNKPKATEMRSVDTRAEMNEDIGHGDGPARRPADPEQERDLADPDRARQEHLTTRAGDTTRTDPAQQHIQRLEQIQREADEKREQDRDERER